MVKVKVKAKGRGHAGVRHVLFGQAELVAVYSWCTLTAAALGLFLFLDSS